MNSVKTSKAKNTILLTLPNVSLVRENESGESCRDAEDIETATNNKPFQGECESVADDGDDEQYFCPQEVTSPSTKEKLSPELQDVYKLLTLLPSFSHASWRGFGSAAARRSTPDTAARKMSSRAKTRKKCVNRQIKLGKYQGSTDDPGSLPEDDDNGYPPPAEDDNPKNRLNREVIKAPHTPLLRVR